MDSTITTPADPDTRRAAILDHLRQNVPELAIYIACFVGLLSVLLASDAFDRFYAWSRGHEAWQIDEIFLAFCAMGIVSFAFVLRRWVLEYRNKRKIVLLSVELTEALKAAKAADEAKSTFLATLSHELRTPLNTINGYAELMESGIMGPIDTRYVSYARDIRESGEHLLSIINGMLDLTRAASGALDLQCANVDARELTQASLKVMAPQADAKDIEFDYSFSADFPDIYADPQRLRQVFINLIDNAVKFSPPGSRVVISGQVQAGEVCIAVSDRGIGMDPKDVPRICEPFVQLESDFAREQEGAGLGLALAKRIVALHGGTLTFETAPRQGTTATVSLPRAAALPEAVFTRAAGA